MVAQQLFTVREFDGFARRPENADRLLEYIGGEVFEVVSNPYSSKIAALIIGALIAYLKEHDLGHVTGADGGYMVSGERYIPDVAFISYSKQPELDYAERYNPNPPDLAVEVLSPGNDYDKMAVKVANYLAAGTIVWMVKPREKQVAVFEPGKPVEMLSARHTLTGGEVLPGFTLKVEEVFPQ